MTAPSYYLIKMKLFSLFLLKTVSEATTWWFKTRNKLFLKLRWSETKLSLFYLFFNLLQILLINIPTIKYTFCYCEELHKTNLTCRVKVYLWQWELCLSPQVKSWLKRNKPVKTRSLNQHSQKYVIILS